MRSLLFVPGDSPKKQQKGLDCGTDALIFLLLLFPAVMAGVHHAEVIAVKVGEPFGTLVLAIAVDALGKDRVRESNGLVLTVAPQITNLPQIVARAGDGSATVTIVFTPALRADQRAVLVLGADEHPPLTTGATPTSLDYRIADAVVGVHLARLRIDGIDSPIVNMDF